MISILGVVSPSWGQGNNCASQIAKYQHILNNMISVAAVIKTLRQKQTLVQYMGDFADLAEELDEQAHQISLTCPE